jgi:Tol biopolymer transport system component
VLRASGSRIFEFEGHALHPSVPRSGEPVYFELLAGGHSRISMVRDSSQTPESVAGADLDGIEPAISPDGTKLAFVSRGSLVVIEGGVRSVLASGAVSSPGFFPDNRRIAFAQGPTGNRGIRSATLAGNEHGDEPRTLVEGGDCFEPAVSPDGSSLAFSCSGSGGSQVWLLDLKTGVRRQITHGDCNNTVPAWDPDSSSVVFSSDCNRGVELPSLYRAEIRQ